MNIFTKWLKQPFLHFVLGGLLIFVAYEWRGEAESIELSAAPIEVNREALLNFMQYQAQAFNPEVFAEQLDTMSEARRDNLIASYVREEALYREALDIGLEEGDYDIRLRLVQKMSFLLEDIAASRVERMDISEEELEAFFEGRAEDYRVGAVYSFTHIFFDRLARGDQEAQSEAEALLSRLRDRAAPAETAEEYGDRFRFLRTYSERSEDQVVNNFGRDFVNQLDQIDIQDPGWVGPMASRLGWHLVYLTDRSPSRIPELDEVREEVLNDYRYLLFAEALSEAESELVGQYKVEVEANAR